MSLIENGLAKGYIRFDADRKFITYVFQNKKRNYTNPEEQVQAETFLKLILVYGYPVRRIRQFVTVTMGSTTKEADLVVYDDDECLEPKIIVECKKPEVSELEFLQAVDQAFSYAFATPKNVKFIWVSSGIKDRYFTVNKEKDERKDESDIPQFGVDKLAKYKYAKGGFGQNTAQDNAAAYGIQKSFELETVAEDELTRRFRQAHQSLWAGGELNPSEAFDELDKLIFCKIWDERHPRKIGEPYHFQIISEEAEGDVSPDEKTTSELYKRIKELYAEGQKRDPEVFKDDIRLTPQKVKTVVGYLEGINLSKTDLDSKGRAFEEFMGSYFRGDFGQFFTPRNIVKFIVEVMPIKNTSRVLDTSCGSGGFLLYALDKVRNEATEFYPNWENDPDHRQQHYKFWHDFAEKNLYGIEINEQIARTAKMNMIIHDDGHTNVIAADGLLKSTELIKRSSNNGFGYNKFDVIITNPPFGSTVRQAERAYLNQYNFGVKEANWLDLKSSAVENRANQSTEVLFIEQCHNFLHEGGYMAVVIPDGILTNNSLQYVRDQIENWYRIIAVVSMPQDAFSHTGANVKSSVLFLRKWSKTTTEKIADIKSGLQAKIKLESFYTHQIETIEATKKEILRKHEGFTNGTGFNDRKSIEATDAFKIWKAEITAAHTQKVNDLKEQLEDSYQKYKQDVLDDYPIFMAIANKIGYDATGKVIAENELEDISRELKRFIQHIDKIEEI